MGFQRIAWALVLGLSVNVWAKGNGIPDLPPDATVTQLQFQIMQSGRAFPLDANSNDPINQARLIGTRNLEWLKFINQHLPTGQKLSFSSPSTQNGYPINKPVEYSPDLIAQRLASLERGLPAAMRDVLLNNAPFTVTPPGSAVEYLAWGRKIDGVYQTALRWLMMQPYLEYLAQARAKDIRGYYYFNGMTDFVRQAVLSHPKKWMANSQYTDWMISLCMNNGQDLRTCKARLNQAIQNDENLLPLYKTWEPAGAQTYAAFFTIPAQVARHDLTFTDPNALHVPFLDPQSPDVLTFLRDNIQAEWQYQTWHLLLDFTSTAAAHVRFVPGATPHVNKLGGDEITLNADAPLTEYDVQWTIRHEFGHVLGFPDCYVEYYDLDRKVMVSYQLDVHNLMCSRKGHIEAQHVSELRRVYGAKSLAALGK